MKMMTTKLRIVPRLIIDLRDWYREVFISPQQLDEELKPGVVRPTGKVRVFAESVVGDSSWPFAGLSELVAQRSDNGILSFHGRVQRVLTPLSAAPMASVLVGPHMRLDKVARCRLTLLADGFQPVVVDSVELIEPLEGDANSPTRLTVSLMPSVLYGFPATATAPTLLTGQVLRGNKPLFGAKIKVLSPPVGASPPRATDAVLSDLSGRFLLVLDAIDPTSPPTYTQRPLSPTVIHIEYQGSQKQVSAAIVAGSRNSLSPIEI